jgi:hypothetical protein
LREVTVGKVGTQPPVWLKEAKASSEARAREVDDVASPQPAPPIATPADSRALEAPTARPQSGEAVRADGKELVQTARRVAGTLRDLLARKAQGKPTTQDVGQLKRQIQQAADQALVLTRSAASFVRDRLGTIDPVTGQGVRGSPQLPPVVSPPIDPHLVDEGRFAVDMKTFFADKPWHASRLFTQYYSGLQASFPNPDEVDSKQALTSWIKDKDDNFNVVPLVSDDGKIQGGVHYRVVDTDAGYVGVIEHVWVEKDARNHKAGSELVKRAMAAMEAEAKDMRGAEGGNKKFLGCFLEVDDPKSVKPEDSGMDPYDRQLFWDKQGAYLLEGMKYIQAPLERWAKGAEQEHAVDTLTAMFIPTEEVLKRGELPKEEALSIAKSYFDTFNSAQFLENAGKTWDDTWTFQTMTAETADTVKLVKVTDSEAYKKELDKRLRQREADASELGTERLAA